MSALRGDGNHPPFSLIERKNCDVVDVCICAEKVFRRSNKSGRSLSPLSTIACMVSEVLTMCISKPLFTNLQIWLSCGN